MASPTKGIAHHFFYISVFE